MAVSLPRQEPPDESAKKKGPGHPEEDPQRAKREDPRRTGTGRARAAGVGGNADKDDAEPEAGQADADTDDEQDPQEDDLGQGQLRSHGGQSVAFQV